MATESLIVEDGNCRYLKEMSTSDNLQQLMDPLSQFAREQETLKHRTDEENQHENMQEPIDSTDPKLFVDQELGLRKRKPSKDDRSTRPDDDEHVVVSELTSKELFNSIQVTKQRIFKIIVLGDTNVGKTCLTLRFCAGTFTGRTEATIGVDFREKNVEIGGDVVKLQIWDTAGLERFRRSMLPHYYRNANAIVFVYDITQQSSFDSLSGWIKECDENSLRDTVPRILIGNKCDIIDRVAVTTSQAQRFADSHEMPLFETSAKDNSESDHVEAIFMTLAYKLKGCRPWMKLPNSCAGSPMQLMTETVRKKKKVPTVCAC